MSETTKIGGLSVKFYESSKESFASTNEYLDSLLAKYGKVVAPPSLPSVPIPSAPLLSLSPPPLSPVSTFPSRCLLINNSRRGHLRTASPPRSAQTKPTAAPAGFYPPPHNQPPPYYLPHHEGRAGYGFAPPPSNLYGAPPPFGSEGSYQNYQGGSGMTMPQLSPHSHYGYGAVPGVAASSSPGSDTGGGNIGMVEKLKQLEQLRANILQGTRGGRGQEGDPIGGRGERGARDWGDGGEGGEGQRRGWDRGGEGWTDDREEVTEGQRVQRAEGEKEGVEVSGGGQKEGNLDGVDPPSTALTHPPPAPFIFLQGPQGPTPQP